MAGARGAAASGERRRDRSWRDALVDLDPLEQRLTLQMRAALWREGRLIAQEEHTFQATLYFRNELLLMLAQAGFADVAVRAGYSDAPATAAGHDGGVRRPEGRMTPAPAAPPEVAGQPGVRNGRQIRAQARWSSPWSRSARRS